MIKPLGFRGARGAAKLRRQPGKGKYSTEARLPLSSRRFFVARAILAMTSNTNTDIDSLITFGKMAFEQDWYDQELDYRPPYLDDEPVRLALSVDL